MPISIDEFSCKPLYLETFLDNIKLGVATGFIIKKNRSCYLITNWHVVTMRNPRDSRPISSTRIADPNILKVWFHGNRLGQ